jgi:hypothetical protein
MPLQENGRRPAKPGDFPFMRGKDAGSGARQGEPGKLLLNRRSVVMPRGSDIPGEQNHFRGKSRDQQAKAFGQMFRLELYRMQSTCVAFIGQRQ